MRLLKVYGGLFLIIVSVFFMGVSVPAAQIMDLQEVQPGMEGNSRTVFKGIEIEEFPIEVVDIVSGDLDNDLILIKVSGEKMEDIGGIASGMSGSPVYIDDQLVGAISYGWEDNDEYALVTPIKQMFKLLDNNKDLTEKDDRISALETPLIVSGLSGRALDKFREDMSSLRDFKVVAGGQNQSVSAADFEPVPGSSIAVQLVRGDISVAAVGTLTYREENSVLALGHSFTNRGNVNLMFSGAEVNEIIPGTDTPPFKLGVPLSEMVGTIYADRRAGIAGKLATYPQIIPLQVEITDQDRQISHEVKTQLINDQDYLNSLGTSIVLESIDNTIDRIGSGTSRVSIEVKGNGLPEFIVKRENIFYSQNDIAAASLSEISEFMNLLSTNPFQRVQIFNIKVEVDIVEEHKNAILQRVQVLNEEIHPGDTLKLELDIQPFRAEAETRQLEVKLPEDIEPGPGTLLIDGGYSWLYGQYYNQETNYEDDLEEIEKQEVYRNGYKDLESMIGDFLHRPRNNEVIFQFNSHYGSVPSSEESKDSQPEPEIEESEDHVEEEEKIAETKQEGPEEDPEEPPQEVEEDDDSSPTALYTEDILDTIRTDYVVEGKLQIELEITEKNDDRSSEKE
ncbi:MAG: SpoIVB peptidase S55 domain-containing protein [Bacillota bacterium]